MNGMTDPHRVSGQLHLLLTTHFTGLPEQGDVERYSAAYRELFGNSLRPFTLLAFLFNSQQDVS